MTTRTRDKFDLHGKVAVLTGGGGLLGREFTRTLLEEGARVIVADISLSAATSAADSARQAAGQEVLPMQVDVRKPDDVARLMATAVAQWGRVDILINNAAIDPKCEPGDGVGESPGFEDYPLAAWQQSLDVNLTGTFLCAQAAGKLMRAQQHGVIVNICSIYGLVGPDQRLYQRDDEEVQSFFKPAAYAVTKAGIAQLTRFLAVYWAGKNIRVNSLTPGGVRNAQDNNFLRRYQERAPMGRMADRTEMSAALLFLASDASSYMTGANLVVDGGWTAW